MEIGTLDFPHAYKHVPITDDRKEFGAILAAPPARVSNVATLKNTTARTK